MGNYNYVFVDKNSINEELINQMYEVEKTSGGEPYAYDSFRQIILNDTNLTSICFDDKNAVGIITANLQSKKFGGCVYIINLSVKKNYHRKGIASQLIKTMLKYIRNNFSDTLCKIALEVDKNNLPAYNLYKKLGFQLDENYFDDEQYGMIMDADKLNEMIEK